MFDRCTQIVYKTRGGHNERYLDIFWMRHTHLPCRSKWVAVVAYQSLSNKIYGRGANSRLFVLWILEGFCCKMGV